MGKARGSFGHQQLADQFTQRIKTHFAQAEHSGESSLVIGVFGEWGSGKSNLLDLVSANFAEAEPTAEEQNQAPVIVIPFNPWRYEKEEHLIVPLLKTMQLEILNFHVENETLGDDVKQGLKAIFTFLGGSAIAFAKGITLKVGPKTFSTEVNFKEMIDGFEKEFEEANKEPKHGLMGLESYYFEFEKQLKTYTKGEASIRLLFLIDDLDRCLPEKAVEMLESIKLFLDVEGCAFMLALDDEVVERGIIHRYRDYLFQGNAAHNAPQNHHAQLPITGIEYLEKIIQLPFRLPQPSKQEMRLFLQSHYPDLFGSKMQAQEDAEMLSHNPHSKQAEKYNSNAVELLELFVNHIPAIPRKQIRAAELLQLLKEMVNGRRSDHRIDDIPLAKFTLLQMFAPDLYRFGRRKYSGFMKLLEEWSEQPYWRYKDHFHNLIKIRYDIEAIKGNPALENTERCLPSIVKAIKDENAEKEVTAGKPHNDVLKGEQRLYHRYYRELIEAFDKAAHSRSGFDLHRFVSSMKIGDYDLQAYFMLMDETPEQVEAEAINPDLVDQASLPIAMISDKDEFLDLLFSESESGWQSALQRTELAGKVLDDDLFNAIQERLQDGFSHFTAQAKWLAYLSPHLSKNQFQQILDTTDNLIEIFDAGIATGSTQDPFEADVAKAHLLNALREEQRLLLPEETARVQRHLLKRMADEKQDIQIRAKAGRALNKLDNRKGVGVTRIADGLLVPDIDWVKIPAGEFMMGSDQDDPDADDDEKPAHKVNVKAFSIACYPITNAQYRCFIEAGGYTDNQLLGLLPDNARAWFEENSNSEPEYWKEEKWNLDNHPVVGVSWYEALAFTIWLDQQYDKQKIHLPYEEEWEYAARGSGSLKYAWGNEPDPSKGNYDGTGLGRTSPVGLFSQGQAFEKAPSDMSGNVWEWTSSVWDEYSKYANWDATEDRVRNKLDDNGDRIFRGGSWDLINFFSRCAIRNWNYSEYQEDSIGFRVVLVE